jgi:hypothetical protein
MKSSQMMSHTNMELVANILETASIPITRGWSFGETALTDIGYHPRKSVPVRVHFQLTALGFSLI